MNKSLAMISLLGVFLAVACTPVPPMDAGDKLVIPAGHTFVIPPEGIRFSNGATIGVVRE